MRKRVVYISHTTYNLYAMEQLGSQIMSDHPDVLPIIPRLMNWITDQNDYKSFFQKGRIDEVWVFGNTVDDLSIKEIMWATELGIPLLFKS